MRQLVIDKWLSSHLSMKADTLFSIRTSEDSINKNDLVKELDILIVLDMEPFHLTRISVLACD